MKTNSTSQIPRKLAKKVILLTLAALALAASSALAADANWIGTTGSWFDAGSWDTHQAPDANTNAFINNGGTAQINADAPMAEALSLTLGLNAGDSGTVQVTPPFGDLSVSQAIFVGKQGAGKLASTFGTTTSTTASIGSLAGSNGSVTVDGTSSTWAVSGEFDVGGTTTGAGGTALLTVSNGGTVTAASLHVWNSGTLTGNGTVSVNSGSGTATVDGTLAPSGTLTISGNLTFASSAANMRCNVSSTSVDKAEVSGIATLNGKLSVTLNGFFTGDFTLLHANGGLGTTSFSSYSFTYTGCLSPSIVYNRANGDVILHVVSTCQ